MTVHVRPPEVVDLRSDTVTHPTAEMRAAMAAAPVGDDVFGDDPTVAKLEEMAASRMGKETAVFVPSGTMANLAAMLAHCGRGDEIILGAQNHTFLFEAGGTAALGGIHPHPIPNLPDGRLDLGDIESAVRADDPHFPPTRLVCLENSHNRCGGAVLDESYMASVRDVADKHSLAVHLDGARLFNAAAALGTSVAALAADADSVSFCLSKGLAAPVGSLVCGSDVFIQRARRARKMLGGGMRQAGVIAAAGIVALETMVDRLVEDHVNARRLAEGLAEMPGVRIDLDGVQTNIVIFGLEHDGVRPADFAARLRERDVWLLPIGGTQLRAVTHYQVTPDGVEKALEAARSILA
ncbi:MAG: low-specificity L-threonine aldolase [Anaerolineae bacterium]